MPLPRKSILSFLSPKFPITFLKIESNPVIDLNRLSVARSSGCSNDFELILVRTSILSDLIFIQTPNLNEDDYNDRLFALTLKY